MKYTIWKNFHYSFPPKFSFTKENKLEWLVNFDESCRYDLKSVDQKDINKLVGVRMNLFTNHKNSFRFGWVYNNEKGLIDIYAYYYINGFCKKWDCPLLTSVAIGKEFKVGLEFTEGSVIFRTERIEHWVSYSGFNQIKYLSSPFFGGDIAALHKMQLLVNKMGYFKK